MASKKLSLPIVLGTQSKWRRKIFQSLGYEFDTASADIDEKAVTADGDKDGRAYSDPSALVLAIGKAKAEALKASMKEKYPDGVLLITSDQVVCHNGTIREKPETAEQCRQYLKSYEDTPACTVASVIVTNTKTGVQLSDVDIAKQHFKPVPADIVDQLIEKGDIMYCCGGFMIDDPLLEPYLGKREGDEDSIIGLPLKLTQSLLEKADVSP